MSNFILDPIFWIYFVPIIFVSILGSVATTKNVNSEWYRSLNKPDFIPPSFYFSFIWGFIYFLLAYVMSKVYHLIPTSEGRNYLNFILALNLTLNLLWSVLFFNNRKILAGLIVILLLLASTIWLVFTIYRYSPIYASYLLIYIGWLSVATYINYSIFINN